LIAGLVPPVLVAPPIDTIKLIGTHAEIGARPSNAKDGKEDEIFFRRVGMFETFEDLLGLDITHFLKIHERDFHIYRARVVPWVKVLSRDICYRVFERKTVVEIIDAVAEEANKTFPHLIIDTAALKDGKFPPFPPIEYCCQYGESTLEFISRLMARFGIWYFFGHRASGPNFVLNEAMILKRNVDASVSTAGLLLLNETQQALFLSPSVAPYVAHHRVTAGGARSIRFDSTAGRLGILLESAKFLRFRASSRALWPSRKLLIASVCRLLIRVRSTADRGALIPAKTRHRSDGEFQELHPSASLAERPADATLSQRRAASPSSRRSAVRRGRPR
jgi:hypothetical protein